MIAVAIDVANLYAAIAQRLNLGDARLNPDAVPLDLQEEMLQGANWALRATRCV